MNILIVEDEKLLADSIGALLAQKGFSVEVVYDGEAGIQYAELGIYDLLVLDVMMPSWTDTRWPAGSAPSTWGHPSSC